jgi:hypothetical protein
MMNPPIETNEQRHLAAQPEPIVTELERLAECGFTAKENMMETVVILLNHPRAHLLPLPSFRGSSIREAKRAVGQGQLSEDEHRSNRSMVSWHNY